MLDSLEDWQGFMITVGCGLVNALLCWFGKITSADFVLVTGSTVGVFLGSRAWMRRGYAAQSDQSVS